MNDRGFSKMASGTVVRLAREMRGRRQLGGEIVTFPAGTEMQILRPHDQLQNADPRVRRFNGGGRWTCWARQAGTDDAYRVMLSPADVAEVVGMMVDEDLRRPRRGEG